jgi:hypothetical protein
LAQADGSDAADEDKMMIDQLPDDKDQDTQMLHPGSRQLFRYWETLRAEKAYPRREDVDFSALKAVMPDLVVIERDFLRKSFRYRLAGSRVCGLFGANMTTKDVFTDWDHFETDVIRRHLEIALTRFQPAVIRMRLTTDRGQQLAAELVVLPVQMQNSNRVQLIGGMFPFRPAAGLGHTAITKRELVSARVIWTEHQGDLPVQHELSLQTAGERPFPRNFKLIEGGLADAKA